MHGVTPAHHLQRAPDDAAQDVAVPQPRVALGDLHKVGEGIILQDLRATALYFTVQFPMGPSGARQEHARHGALSSPGVLTSLQENLLTRLHSVLSAFQFVTVAVVFRNILKPTCLQIRSIFMRSAAQGVTRRASQTQQNRDAFAGQGLPAHLGDLVRCVPEVGAAPRLGLCKELVNEPDADVVPPACPCQSPSGCMQRCRRSQQKTRRKVGALHGVQLLVDLIHVLQV